MNPVGMLILAGAEAALFVLLLIAWDIYHYPVCYYCGDNMRTTRFPASGAYCRRHGSLVPQKERFSYWDGERQATRTHIIFVRAA